MRTSSCDRPDVISSSWHPYSWLYVGPGLKNATLHIFLASLLVHAWPVAPKERCGPRTRPRDGLFLLVWWQCIRFNYGRHHGRETIGKRKHIEVIRKHIGTWGWGGSQALGAIKRSSTSTRHGWRVPVQYAVSQGLTPTPCGYIMTVGPINPGERKMFFVTSLCNFVHLLTSRPDCRNSHWFAISRSGEASNSFDAWCSGMDSWVPDLGLKSHRYLLLPREYSRSGLASRGASNSHRLATWDLNLPSFSILDTGEFPRSGFEVSMRVSATRAATVKLRCYCAVVQRSKLFEC